MTIEIFGPTAPTALKFGDQKINPRPLGSAEQDPAWTTGVVETAGSEDLCFITLASPGTVREHLENCGVEVLDGPVTKLVPSARWSRTIVANPTEASSRSPSTREPTTPRRNYSRFNVVQCCLRRLSTSFPAVHLESSFVTGLCGSRFSDRSSAVRVRRTVLFQIADRTGFEKVSDRRPMAFEGNLATSIVYRVSEGGDGALSVGCCRLHCVGPVSSFFQRPVGPFCDVVEVADHEPVGQCHQMILLGECAGFGGRNPLCV